MVTAFEYRLHPVSQMLGELLIYPIATAKALFRFYRDFTRTPPDALGSLINLATLLDGTPAAVILMAYSGTLDDGERLLQPLRGFGPPLADQVSQLPYTALQSIVENFNPPGLRNYWKSNYLQALSDGAIDVLVDHYATVPAPYTHLVIEHLGGAVSRVGPDETAVDHREALYNFLIVGMWPTQRRMRRSSAGYGSSGGHSNHSRPAACMSITRRTITWVGSKRPTAPQSMRGSWP